MTQQQISMKILSKVEEGISVREAYDQVFGAGAYDKLAGMIYDELKAKATNEIY